MTVRATARGAQRTSLDGERADVIVCGASFAGLAVARELAGSGADVLVVDRYEIGERQTSACACPTPWLHAMGVSASIRQELPYMSFTTPQRTARYRLPWSWSAFDYRELCELLWAQCDGARFETATVSGCGALDADGRIRVTTDRGELSAPLVVDALGWRRVLASRHYQPPDAPLSRGLEVHPAHDGSGDALDLWIERGVVSRGYGWRVPAEDEVRVGALSYEPRDGVRDPVGEMASKLDVPLDGFQGNWFPHRLRDAVEGGVFFVGDSAGHCLPLSGEGIRTAFYFGVAAGRELRAVVEGRQPRERALEHYAEFHDGHRRTFAWALFLQRVIPALPPRALTLVFRMIGRQRLIDRSFGWYMDKAHPSFAVPAPQRAPQPEPELTSRAAAA